MTNEPPIDQTAAFLAEIRARAERAAAFGGDPAPGTALGDVFLLLAVADRLLDELAALRLAEAAAEEGGEPEWEYGVRWGDEPDDSRPALCGSRKHAESRAAESHGDKIVRRIKARTIPAGGWEEA